MIAFVSARLMLQHRYDVVEIVYVTLFNILIYYNIRYVYIIFLVYTIKICVFTIINKMLKALCPKRLGLNSGFYRPALPFFSGRKNEVFCLNIGFQPF